MTSYQKVQATNKTFEQNEHIIHDDDQPLPTCYLRCPKCKNNEIDKCTCTMFNNYECTRCGWQHTNHRHVIPGVTH